MAVPILLIGLAGLTGLALWKAESVQKTGTLIAVGGGIAFAYGMKEKDPTLRKWGLLAMIAGGGTALAVRKTRGLIEENISEVRDIIAPKPRATSKTPSYLDPKDIVKLIRLVFQQRPYLKEWMDEGLIMAIIERESGGNWLAYRPEPTSKWCSASFGLMQVCYETAREVNTLYGLGYDLSDPDILFTPLVNLDIGMHVLLQKITWCRRRYQKAKKEQIIRCGLRAYNGWGNPYSAYADRVLSRVPVWRAVVKIQDILPL